MIRAGFIGTGNISGVHLGYLKTRRDVDIVGLCDVNRENLEKRHKEYGGHLYSDFEEMLDRTRPDAVWICTPPQVRRDPLMACADRGIPVLCEKPVERDLKKAERIAAELKKRKACVQVGYVFRSMPTVQALQKSIADDRIHLVQSCYACNVSITMKLPAWFYDKKQSGGGLVDQATHDLDLLRMLIGEVKEVRGVASNPVNGRKKGYTIDEVIGLSFVFKNGAVGGHVHTWVGDAWRNEMHFIGEKREYRLNLWQGTLTIDEGDKSCMIRQEQGRMYWHQNERFLDMVKSGDWSRNPCTYADGVETLRLTVACDKAVS